jgi:hypothetical protein
MPAPWRGGAAVDRQRDEDGASRFSADRVPECASMMTATRTGSARRAVGEVRQSHVVWARRRSRSRVRLAAAGRSAVLYRVTTRRPTSRRRFAESVEMPGGTGLAGPVTQEEIGTAVPRSGVRAWPHEGGADQGRARCLRNQGLRWVGALGRFRQALVGYGQAMAADFDIAESLDFIQHELDMLADTRSLGGFRQIDECRYQELCGKERALLRHTNGQARRLALV